MKLELYYPDSSKRDPKSVKEFLQKMVNRLVVGEYRYGAPKKSQNYLSRLKTEVRAYSKTGNQEQLINIANYCWLESVAPEHKKSNFNPGVDSVTRGRFGI